MNCIQSENRSTRIRSRSSASCRALKVAIVGLLAVAILASCQTKNANLSTKLRLGYFANVTHMQALVGLAAILLLIPLAITSTKGWQRRLGKRWKILHRLVYIAAPLAVVHFVWLVKSDIREPLLYGAAVVVLLALRLPTIRRLFRTRRRTDPVALPVENREPRTKNQWNKRTRPE